MKKIVKLSKSKIIVLVVAIVMILSSLAFAAVVNVTYNVYVGNENITDRASNDGEGSTLLPARLVLEKFGYNVDWKPGVATFSANNYGDLEKIEKSVVRLYQDDKYVGNGFFVRKSKILTTYDVSMRTEGVENLTAKLWDDKEIDVTNFRRNEHRLLAMADTKGFESDYVVDLADNNADKKTKTTLITSTEITGNDDLVPNQISVGDIKKVNYEYDSNGVLYSLLNNDTDNRLEGNMSIGGLVVDAYGKTIGIFDKVEPGNNGNIFMTPVSYIKMFLEDESD